MNKLVFIFSSLVVLACAGCSSSVTGTVESVEEKSSFFQNGNIAGSERFVAMTIRADGGKHYVGLSHEFIWLDNEYRFRPGDTVTLKLGRTAFSTPVPEHAVREGNGTMKVVEETTIKWRRIEEYKIITSGAKTQ